MVRITMKKKELLLVYGIVHLAVIAFMVMSFASCGYSKIKKAKDFVFGEETEYWYVASRNTNIYSGADNVIGRVYVGDTIKPYGSRQLCGENVKYQFNIKYEGQDGYVDCDDFKKVFSDKKQRNAVERYNDSIAGQNTLTANFINWWNGLERTPYNKGWIWGILGCIGLTFILTLWGKRWMIMCGVLAVCVCEIVYCMTTTDPTWFCEPDTTGWLLTILNFCLYAGLVVLQFYIYLDESVTVPVLWWGVKIHHICTILFIPIVLAVGAFFPEFIDIPVFVYLATMIMQIGLYVHGATKIHYYEDMVIHLCFCTIIAMSTIMITVYFVSLVFWALLIVMTIGAGVALLAAGLVHGRNMKHSVTFGSSTSLRDQHGHSVDVDDYGHGNDGKWYGKNNDGTWSEK